MPITPLNLTAYEPDDGDTGDAVPIKAAFEAIVTAVNALLGITVNGHAIASNVSVTAADVAAIATSVLDTDNTLAADSDAKIASQKAVKAWIATQIATRIATSVLDTDTALAADSATRIPSQHAVKAYADGISSGLNPGAWTPYTPATITGWQTSGRSANFSYLRIGTKTVMLSFLVTGVSNGTSAEFSPPPLGDTSANQFVMSPWVKDNGVELQALGYIPASSSGTFRADRTFVTSGGKGLGGLYIYELA